MHTLNGSQLPVIPVPGGLTCDVGTCTLMLHIYTTRNTHIHIKQINAGCGDGHTESQYLGIFSEFKVSQGYKARPYPERKQKALKQCCHSCTSCTNYLISSLGYIPTFAFFCIFKCRCMYPCECMPGTCVYVNVCAIPTEVIPECWLPWSWSYSYSWSTWCRCWDLNSSPLEGHHMLLIPESSFQSTWII